MAYQKLIILGRLGRDPELRYTPTGSPVCSFPVATDRQYTDKSGKNVKETCWFRVTFWGKQAESCNTYLAKGKMVLVEGRLAVDAKTGGPRVWAGQDGTVRASFEITGAMIKFLSPSHETNSASVEATEAETEEIPF